MVPDEFDPLDYDEGRKPEADGEVAIDSATAENEGFELGDTITISGPGETRELELVGTATLGGSSSLGGATITVMTLPTAQAVTGKPGQFDAVRVAAADGTTPERLAADLQAALPNGIEAETGEQDTQSQKDDINEGIGFLQDRAARLRRRLAVRRLVPDLQHLLDHRRPAHARVRDAPHPRRQPPPARSPR